ncbi:MAG: TIGR00304 family membrane protein [Candidatus Bathyarchaeia archaeon]
MVSEKEEDERIKRYIMLFFIGFFIILVGVIITVAAALLFGEGTASLGGFILIGPFPIVFGAGPGATWLALFAIILGILSLTLLLILWRRKS